MTPPSSDPQDRSPRVRKQWVSPWGIDPKWEKKANEERSPAPRAYPGPNTSPARAEWEPPARAVTTATPPAAVPEPRAQEDDSPYAPPHTPATERVLVQRAPSTDHAVKVAAKDPPTTRQSVPVLPKPGEAPLPAQAIANQRKAAGTKGLFGIGKYGFLVLGLVSLVFLGLVYFLDSEPVEDNDLRLQEQPTDMVVEKIHVPDRLKLLLDSVPGRIQGEMRNPLPWEWDTPTLASWVQTSTATLDNLRDLLEEPNWHPRHAAWDSEDLGSHKAWSAAAQLLQVRSAYLMRRGEPEAALLAALDLLRLSEKLQGIRAWPSYAHRALDLHQRCCQSTAEILKATRLSSETLGQFQEKFSEHAPQLAGMLDTLNGGYQFEKKSLLNPEGEGDESAGQLASLLKQMNPARWFFKPQETLERFAVTFRSLRDEVTAAPSADVLELLSRRAMQTAPHFYQPNASGERYFANRIDPYLSLPQDFRLAEARHGLIESAFAIRRYLADQKRLPDGWDALHPAYLKSLPADPFSGEAFIYDPAIGRLYSVGVNRVMDRTDEKPSLLNPREPGLDLGVSQAKALR